ncbi:MAG: M28 family metallopeptidase [Candidatus Hodarchaeota archaeon]
MSTLLLYDEQATIKHVESLAFNRNASSPGETEALNYIEKELVEANIDPKTEHFEWVGPMKILLRVTYAIIVIFLILLRAYLVIVVYFIIKNMFEKTRRMSITKNEESKNLYAQISAKEDIPNRPIAIISAHYDSISTNIPYKLQVIVFFVYRLIVLFYGLMIIAISVIAVLDIIEIFPFSDDLIFIIIITTISGAFVSIPILYLVFTEKTSSGSIDNASGVAILIEMAKLFKKNPLEKIDLLFLWAGAEEWGLKGSAKFCKTHFLSLKKKFDLNRSLNINIDMLGTYIGLLDKTGLIIKRKLNENLNDILEATAKQLQIPLVKYNKIIKPKSDYKTFRRYGRRARSKFQVSCFHSSNDSKYIHSLKDTPDKCSSENLNGCLNICHQALRSIDSRIGDI